MNVEQDFAFAAACASEPKDPGLEWLAAYAADCAAMEEAAEINARALCSGLVDVAHMDPYM